MANSRLIGKTAIISGGAGGVGRATSRLFAAEGARVCILDIQARAGNEVVAEIEAAGGEAMFVETDVSKAGLVDAAIRASLARFGRIDILFNHAGAIVIKPFLETTEEDWDRLMDINVKSMFLVTKAVLPAMLAAGRGAIVIMSSVSGVMATPMESLYCTTKGAVLQFARAIAAEYRDNGIRCNALCPGFIRTDHGLREIRELGAVGVDASETAITAMQGRICEPEEVARAALFLASDDASFVSGAALFVDNTFTAGT